LVDKLVFHAKRTFGKGGKGGDRGRKGGKKTFQNSVLAPETRRGGGRKNEGLCIERVEL